MKDWVNSHYKKFKSISNKIIKKFKKNLKFCSFIISLLFLIAGVIKSVGC